MSWTDDTSASTWSASAITATLGAWNADTHSHTTARNASRFLGYHPIDSSVASGGVDFVLTINSVAPFYIVTTQPIYLSVDTRF